MSLSNNSYYEGAINTNNTAQEITLKIDKNSYEVPPIFKLIAERGNIPERDMYNTFNIGMAVIVPESEVEKSLEILKQAGEEAYLIGEVIAGNKEIIV